MAEPLHLTVALDGTGFHPASWRDHSARPSELFSPRYWTDIATTAERGLLDFVTIEDSFGLQSSHRNEPDRRADQVRGRLDAVLIASFLGPVTSHIGLVPTGVVTHTEPFHLASALATLDYVSHGRAGWRPQISARRSDADHVGRRSIPTFDRFSFDDPDVQRLMVELVDEAADAVEVVRRLWDSWEDDAVIKEEATGRYIDRDKLHYVDFVGAHFSVKGPSIVPRPPQGNPVIAALAHSRIPFEFAARSTDVVFVTPTDRHDVGRWVSDVIAAESAVARTLPRLRIFADIVVFLDDSHAEAERRKTRLDELDGSEFVSDAAIFVGTPEHLAEELVAWQDAGLDGFRLRPGVIGHDLDAIVDGLVPALQRGGAFRREYVHETLRSRLDLTRQPSRYAVAASG